MNKKELLETLSNQIESTQKSTRKDIVKMVSNLVVKHFNNNVVINGLNNTRSNSGVNLGELVEIITKKALFNAHAKKSTSEYDYQKDGVKYEIKFTTSDAYAHAINEKQKVDYYIIVAYTKADGGCVFKVPYASKNEIAVNNQNRVITNQKAKFIDRELTEKIFG